MIIGTTGLRITPGCPGEAGMENHIHENRTRKHHWKNLIASFVIIKSQKIKNILKVAVEIILHSKIKIIWSFLSVHHGTDSCERQTSKEDHTKDSNEYPLV